MKELFAKKWVRVSVLAACCAAAVYALVYVDVVMRARSAFLEGEKYWSWHDSPQLKQAALDRDFENEKAALDAKLAKGKLARDEYERRLDIAKFDHDEKLRESSIKYAYIWYQTVVELFSPPESKWVRLSREKMPKAKELWKQELRGRGVKFEDYMLE